MNMILPRKYLKSLCWRGIVILMNRGVVASKSIQNFPRRSAKLTQQWTVFLKKSRGEGTVDYEKFINIFEKDEKIPEGITWKDIQSDYIKFMESDAPKNEKDVLGDYGEMLEMLVDIEEQESTENP